MKFEIKPNEKRTPEQYFKDGDNIIRIKPFKSNIKGLCICFGTNNTGDRRVPFNTENGLKKDISKYTLVYFEYFSTDQDYTIELIID